MFEIEAGEVCAFFLFFLDGRARQTCSHFAQRAERPSGGKSTLMSYLVVQAGHSMIIYAALFLLF